MPHQTDGTAERLETEPKHFTVGPQQDGVYIFLVSSIAQSPLHSQLFRCNPDGYRSLLHGAIARDRITADIRISRAASSTTDRPNHPDPSKRLPQYSSSSANNRAETRHHDRPEQSRPKEVHHQRRYGGRSQEGKQLGQIIVITAPKDVVKALTALGWAQASGKPGDNTGRSRAGFEGGVANPALNPSNANIWEGVCKKSRWQECGGASQKLRSCFHVP